MPAPKKYRVLEGAGPISLRQSADEADPKYEEWFEWKDGVVFEAPEHMNVTKAVKRGLIKPDEGGALRRSKAD